MRKAQGSYKGTELTWGGGQTRRTQKYVCRLPAREAPRGQDGAFSQEGTECPVGRTRAAMKEPIDQEGDDE